MAKTLVKVKNIDKVTANIKKVFNDVKREKTLLNDIGKFVTEKIVSEARKGNSLEGDVKHKLPELKQTSKNIRKAIAKHAPELVDPQFFKANKSNITLTGQLLRSIKYVINRSSVFIVIGGKRTKAIQSSSKKSRTRSSKKQEASTNDDVYKDLVSRGFGFIGLDEKGQKRVKKLVIDEFRRTIKKFFK